MLTLRALRLVNSVLSAFLGSCFSWLCNVLFLTNPAQERAMQIEEELASSSPPKDMVLTIGVFDGVHLGHRYLLSQLKEHAKNKHLLGGVVTFRWHPQAVLSPQTRLPYLTDLEQRIKLLKNEGIEHITTLSFTPEVAQLSARQFAGLLQKYLRMRGLVIGPDFVLGRNREGDTSTLNTLGKDMGFGVTVVPPVMVSSEVVSSTAIRNALAEGNMARVNNMIGRSFSLHGRVIRGEGRGKNLGFPTANLEINPEQALPTDGVYASRAYVDDKAYQSLTNIGRRLTFDGGGRVVEVFLLDYHDNLYQRELKVDIIERLREEKQFDTVDQLKKQMIEDVKQGRAMLNSPGRS
jgi:riboflavin kinase/FMN adenylyltransferase